MKKLKLKTIASLLNERLGSDYDAVVALDGYPGSGKTSMALQLSTMMDPKFDIDKNICYLPDETELKTKFNELPQYSVLLVDEAGRALYKLRWMDKVQQSINSLYMTERKQNKCTFLCIPRFTDLNEHFRNFRVMIWIHILERGVATIYCNDKDKDTGYDPWHFKENISMKQKLWYSRGKRVADITLEDRLRMEEMTPNYMAFCTFDQAPEDIWKKYKETYSEYKKKEINMDMSKPEKLTTLENKYKVNLQRTVFNFVKEGRSVSQISDFTGLTKNQIYDTMKKLNILPGNKKAMEDFEQLEKEINETHKNSLPQ